MQYYDEEQAGALRAALEKKILEWPQVDTRRMFGCPAYVADARLFAFLVTEGVVITQLRLRDRQALAQDYQTEPFQAGERVIERWVKVSVPGPDKLPRLMRFIKRSYETALDH